MDREVDQPKQPAPKEDKKQQQKQQQIIKNKLQANNLLNKLIAYNYNSKFSQNKQIQEEITKFFDMLLWAQKKCPQIIFQLFQMMAIQQIQGIHLNSCVLVFLKNYVLLMTNCKEGGILAQLFLQQKLPHILLEFYLEAEKTHEQRDQTIQYIGSFLKSYHRIFKPQWLEKFLVSTDYFQLLQISFKFHNCPQPITRTTVFTIVLDLLGHREVQEFVLTNKTRYQFYQHMAQLMTRNMRNQLAEFGLRIEHISLDDSIANIMCQIEDKVSLWEDISRICAKLSDIFMLPFSKNVLLPLLIGPLQYEVAPLFTLKYSLFMVQKLLKTIKNFGMLQIFIRMIFIEQKVYYWPVTLQKAKKHPFIIQQILDQTIKTQELVEQEKLDFGPGIKKFYEGLLRSKDNHFILMNTSMLVKLIQCLKDQPQLSQNFGLTPRSPLHTKICQKLISQLWQTHRLITIQALLNTLVVLTNQKPLQTNLENLFLHIFKKKIEQIKGIIKSKSQLWEFIIQVNQYDLLRVNSIRFGKLEDAKKFQEMFKVVFMWDIKCEEASVFSFYSSIPDTVEDHFRYDYIKFLMLRKASKILLSSQIQYSNLINDYYMKFNSNTPYIPGKQYSMFQIKTQMLQCKIIEDTTVIPVRWIMDQNFFVLGFFSKQTKTIKIIVCIKYKHVSTEITQNNQKIMLDISVKVYDYDMERLKEKNSIKLRGMEAALLVKMNTFQSRIRQKQMLFISNAVKRTQQMLPKPNLM